MTLARHSSISGATTVFCMAVAIAEGYDIQVAGIAAAALIPSLHLTATDIGWLFSTGTAGLVLGAWIGGRLADRYGRRWLLRFSLLAFGLASLLTACAPDRSLLLAGRLITGIGLGGALPTILTIAASGTSGKRRFNVAVVYAGLPLGGASVALLFMAFGSTLGWRGLFAVGGLLPLLLAMISPAIHEPAASRLEAVICPASPRRGEALGRTMLACSASFMALLLLHLLLNWLPQLLLGRGVGATSVVQVQLAFNLLGAVGAASAGMLACRPLVAFGTFAAVAVALLYIAGLHNSTVLVLAGSLLGFGVLAAQAGLHVAIPLMFDEDVRATSVGTAVAAGRAGALLGPPAVAALLTGGMTPEHVIRLLAVVALLSGVLFEALARVTRDWPSLTLQA